MEPSSTSPPSPPPSSWTAFPQRTLEAVDIVVLVLYFIFVLAVGLWVGASLFASNVGSGHFIGLAGSGAASGIAATAYEWNGMFCVLVLAWLFVPIYLASGVTTMPEYLQRRFGGKRIQIFLAILYLFIYIFTKISVDMYAGALFIQQALHWDLYIAVIGLLVITAIYTVAGTWDANNQVIVQRSLAAKSLSHAKGGALLASYLKILPLFMMVLPGMISRILFPDLVACADPKSCKEICGNPSGCSDIAYPKLVIELLPLGLRGLMMSVMIAALMSSLTSIFNSASTIFTMDLWRHLRPLSSEWELMIGAFCGLLVGMVIGLIRMVLDFVYLQPGCGESDDRPAVVKYVHYLYFSMILGVITLIVVVVVSLLTEPPPEEMVSALRKTSAVFSLMV
ncbi:hypothetical protein E2320_011968 [Naja naja]|nr:hypothetical protein E2320_011968 [Naja naja]